MSGGAVDVGVQRLVSPPIIEVLRSFCPRRCDQLSSRVQSDTIL
jgi:hypothetical protein